MPLYYLSRLEPGWMNSRIIHYCQEKLIYISTYLQQDRRLWVQICHHCPRSSYKMTYFIPLSVKAVALMALALSATANPLNLKERQDTTCGDITCDIGTICQIIDSEPQCRPISTTCGPALCDTGLVCCNESCGICTLPDAACTQEVCSGPQCGPTTCLVDETCCNESCGICTGLGQVCHDHTCD